MKYCGNCKFVTYNNKLQVCSKCGSGLEKMGFSTQIKDPILYGKISLFTLGLILFWGVVFMFFAFGINHFVAKHEVKESSVIEKMSKSDIIDFEKNINQTVTGCNLEYDMMLDFFKMGESLKSRQYAVKSKLSCSMASAAIVNVDIPAVGYDEKLSEIRNNLSEAYMLKSEIANLIRKNDKNNNNQIKELRKQSSYMEQLSLNKLENIISNF